MLRPEHQEVPKLEGDNTQKAVRVVNVSRRDFLKKAGAAGLGGTVVGLGTGAAGASETRETSDDWMGVLVDITKCIGCRRCEAACREANQFGLLSDEDLEDRAVFAEYRRPAPDCHTVVNAHPAGLPDPQHPPAYVKLNCFHCNEPACVSACLVGAFSKEPDGTVAYDAWRCMGCRYCMIACPFQIPTYEYDNPLTPQVRKCTLCSNEGNPNKGGVPACVSTCPKEVMVYGKRSELIARAHTLIERHPDVYSDHVYGEHEVGGTSWLYLGPKEHSFAEMGFLELGSSPPPMRTERIQHGIFKYFIPPLCWYGLLGAVMWVTRPHGEEA
jgi:Fe-S-cluster-containing dehydrogenase component